MNLSSYYKLLGPLLIIIGIMVLVTKFVYTKKMKKELDEIESYAGTYRFPKVGFLRIIILLLLMILLIYVLSQ